MCHLACFSEGWQGFWGERSASERLMKIVKYTMHLGQKATQENVAARFGFITSVQSLRETLGFEGTCGVRPACKHSMAAVVAHAEVLQNFTD